MLKTAVLVALVVSLGLLAWLPAAGTPAAPTTTRTPPPGPGPSRTPTTAAGFLPLVLRPPADPTLTPTPHITRTPIQPPSTGHTATPTATAAPNCHPSYPTVCIPPPPPDLNCDDVRPLTDFKVLPPDPHGFDGDNDGIGCESP